MKIITKILMIPCLILLVMLITSIFALIIAFPVMWLWNNSIALLGLPKITYWMSYCLYLLCYILFQSSQNNKS